MRPTGLSVRRAQSGYDAPPLVRRVLRPVVELRAGESTTALAMFAYSFLAMTAYNIIKPVTRSKFISDLGADNLPWVQLGAGLLIGVIMHGYARALALVPRRWAIPVTQAGCVALLLGFWALFSAGYDGASAAFYVLGLILGILLISQFWTLANDIYDAAPRQAAVRVHRRRREPRRCHRRRHYRGAWSTASARSTCCSSARR